MLKTDSISDTLNYTIQALAKEPVTYVNTAAIAVSVTDAETTLKLALYGISIVASLLVSIKYILEIKKLKQEAGEPNHELEQETKNDL